MKPPKVCQGCPDRFKDCITKTECQTRVERIFKEIENKFGLPYPVGSKGYREWQALKKQEET